MKIKQNQRLSSSVLKSHIALDGVGGGREAAYGTFSLHRKVRMSAWQDPKSCGPWWQPSATGGLWPVPLRN